MAFKCPYCKREFNTFQGLRQHVQRSHQTNKCLVCGQICLRLNTHIALKSQIDPAHQVYYGLTGTSPGKKDRIWLKECMSFAARSCEV